MKFKKYFSIILCLCIILGLAGCGNKANEKGESINSDIQVENPEEVLESENESGIYEIDETIPLSTTEGIDIDLTMLSSTMVYSEVFNMLYEPDKYIGKTIRMEGVYTEFVDDTTGNMYNACIIEDATACCAQGMEFILSDQYSYPGDYPEEGDDITVVGIFDTYLEGDMTYCTLRDADII